MLQVHNTWKKITAILSMATNAVVMEVNHGSQTNRLNRKHWGFSQSGLVAACSHPRNNLIKHLITQSSMLYKGNMFKGTNSLGANLYFTHDHDEWTILLMVHNVL